MKLREVFRFELAYQARRAQTWLFPAFLGVVAFLSVEANFLSGARDGAFFLNAPYVIASGTLVGSLFWLLVAAAVAGEAAARDVRTRMHPLMYTAPVRKAEYLGGRFLAAFLLNALILLAVPVGLLLAVYTYAEAGLLGPFRPAAYLSAYGLIAVPNAFVVTAIQFSLSVLSRRAMASYLASVLLLVTAYLVAGNSLSLLDPIGVIAIAEHLEGWTPAEKNARLIALEGTLLWNRLLWLGIALGLLALTHFRFRLRHHTATTWRRRSTHRSEAHTPTPASPGSARSTPVFVPPVQPAFGFQAHARQTFALAWASFVNTAKSWGGLLLLVLVIMLAAFSVADPLSRMGVALLPRTDYVLRGLTFPEIPPAWVIIPLLVVFSAGELVWREREAGLSEIVGAAPVSGWVLFLSKFLALGFVLTLCMALWMAVGMLTQASMGYYAFEIGVYLRLLFGMQLAGYLLLALLAYVVHVVVDQKYIGHLVALSAYVLIAVASENELAHPLLVYGSGPEVFYTDMRGFGPSLGPWLWFKGYWTGWALLLAAGAKLLWVRGREGGFKQRLQIARRRFARPTTWIAAVGMGLVFTLGGFIFYNTDVLNEPQTASERSERRAEYERRYGRYKGILQPRLAATSLRVEIYPDRRKVEIRGTYRLVNDSAVPIDSVHLATASEVETTGIDFGRPAALVLGDDALGHRIYALGRPLRLGDSLRLSFGVRFDPQGFPRGGALPADASVFENGTHFTNEAWLPAIGYQANRELGRAGDRRAHRLAPRSLFRALYDVEARQDSVGRGQIAFEAVVGTDSGQVAVAPGALRRTWIEGGRRYFRYATDAPIGDEYALFSADYTVRQTRWKDPGGSGRSVTIRVFHHPEHTANLDHMVRSVRASLDYYTRAFGPYPYGFLSLVEYPGLGTGMHAEAGMITFQEGFSLWNPDASPRGPDLPFLGVAHEVAHQWWGSYLAPARVEGNALLAEGLATYSAYRVVERTYGQKHLHRILSQHRAGAEGAAPRDTVPLLQGTSRFHAYRKGPLALYALSEYVGEKRVNAALRRLLEARRAGALQTSLDLYRELQAVTPDSLQSLLHDLFEANTFWEFETEQATAAETEAGDWRVTLDVQARKTVLDSTGAETEAPMSDWIEVGVFAAERDDTRGEPLYLEKHRIRSGKQQIAVTVPEKPASAGVDPRRLLVDAKGRDNITAVRLAGESNL